MHNLATNVLKFPFVPQKMDASFLAKTSRELQEFVREQKINALHNQIADNEKQMKEILDRWHLKRNSFHLLKGKDRTKYRNLQTNNYLLRSSIFNLDEIKREK